MCADVFRLRTSDASGESAPRIVQAPRSVLERRTLEVLADNTGAGVSIARIVWHRGIATATVLALFLGGCAHSTTTIVASGNTELLADACGRLGLLYVARPSGRFGCGDAHFQFVRGERTETRVEVIENGAFTNAFLVRIGEAAQAQGAELRLDGFPLSPRTSGTCEVVKGIRKLPFKGEFVADAAYYQVLAKGCAAVPELVDCIEDATHVEDPRQGPLYGDVRAGDVAVWLLSEITGHPFERELPANTNFKSEGVYAYFKYVHDPENRKAMRERLAGVVVGASMRKR